MRGLIGGGLLYIQYSRNLNLILIQHGSNVLNLSFKILIHVALSENRKQKTVVTFIVYKLVRGRRCLDLIVEFTYAIIAYHHQSCEFVLRSWRGVLNATFNK